MAKPNLSQIANNSWEDDFSDIDNIIDSEAKAMETAAPTPTPTIQTRESTDTGLQVKPPQHMTTSTPSTPSVQTTPDPRVSQPNPWVEMDKNILDEAINTEGSNMDPNFKDSGTITPQQSLNQGGQTVPQQPIEDNSQLNTEDPYILAFNILQDFDLIRLPEDLDYSNLDVETLEMYKMQTLQEQQEEALYNVRNQVSHDPYMLQLFDYAYYGKGFADVPRMQEVIKEEFDYANYDISSVRAQKAIVKLYYADGLNPADNRDRKILQNIPNQLNQLAEDLKLKDEAMMAKRFFMERAQRKAVQEQERVMGLIQQEEYQRQVEEHDIAQWNQAFVNVLSQRPWSDGKKAAVAAEMGHVTLQSGQQMPLWQYKQEVIFNNPDLFQLFLDFTSKFDLENMSFSDTHGDEAIPQNTLDKIVDRLQRKNTTSSRGPARSGQAPRDPNAPSKPKVVDVKRNWF
jgi:hypothetical protein